MRVRVLVAFNGMRKGDIGDVTTEKALGYIGAGLMEEVHDGTRKTRQSRPAKGDAGGVVAGAADSGTDGDQPGEGFGSGGYGAPASEHSGGADA